MATALATTAGTVFHYVMITPIVTAVRNVSTEVAGHYAQLEINVLKGKYAFKASVCLDVTLTEIAAMTCYVHLNYVLRRAAITLVVKTLYV